MVPFVRLALTPQLVSLSVLSAVSRAVLISVLPDGGQSAARRNAWAGMSAVATRRRMQREAELALEAAHARAGLVAVAQ